MCSPEEGLQALIEYHDGDYGNYEPVTEQSLDEHWENQDRWPPERIDVKVKLLAQIRDGKPWYWFSIHE